MPSTGFPSPVHTFWHTPSVVNSYCPWSSNGCETEKQPIVESAPTVPVYVAEGMIPVGTVAVGAGVADTTWRRYDAARATLSVIESMLMVDGRRGRSVLME